MELRRREARFIAVKQIKDVKEQIQELKGERVWAEVIENEKVCDWDSSPRHIILVASFVIILTTFWMKGERKGDWQNVFTLMVKGLDAYVHFSN